MQDFPAFSGPQQMIPGRSEDALGYVQSPQEERTPGGGVEMRRTLVALFSVGHRVAAGAKGIGAREAIRNDMRTTSPMPPAPSANSTFRVIPPEVEVRP